MINELGKAIKDRRKLLNINQQTLADIAEISINTLYKIERGEANPTILVLTKILDVLGMEMSFKVKE